jgi:hypothetical protein
MLCRGAAKCFFVTTTEDLTLLWRDRSQRSEIELSGSGERSMVGQRPSRPELPGLASGAVPWLAGSGSDERNMVGDWPTRGELRGQVLVF